MKPTPTERDNLATELRRTREAAGIKASAIARRAGVRRGFIAMVESGDRKPSPRVLAAYASLCGLDGDTLCQAWHVIPEDVIERIQNADMWALVRAA